MNLDKDGDGYIVAMPVQALILMVEMLFDYISRIWNLLFKKNTEAST